MSLEYLHFFLFGFFITCIITVIILLNAAIGHGELSAEKISAYECGFNPFSNARQEFDIKFYIVAMSFIILDIEAVLLFPFVFTLTSLTLTSFCTVTLFLVILAVGFIYEWQLGALKWN